VYNVKKEMQTIKIEIIMIVSSHKIILRHPQITIVTMSKPILFRYNLFCEH